MHERSRSHYEIAGDVSGKNVAKRKEAREIDHAGNDTEQRRQPLFQACQFRHFTRRLS
jgi:hypothetical protein